MNKESFRFCIPAISAIEECKLSSKSIEKSSAVDNIFADNTVDDDASPFRSPIDDIGSDFCDSSFANDSDNHSRQLFTYKHACSRPASDLDNSSLASNLNNSAVNDRLSSLSALSSAYSNKRETNQLIVRRRYFRPFGLLHFLLFALFGCKNIEFLITLNFSHGC